MLFFYFCFSRPNVFEGLLPNLQYELLVEFCSDHISQAKELQLLMYLWLKYAVVLQFRLQEFNVPEKLIYAFLPLTTEDLCFSSSRVSADEANTYIMLPALPFHSTDAQPDGVAHDGTSS